MNWLEILFLIIIVYYTWSGFKSGFIRTLGGFLGFLVGIFFASRYYVPIAASWQWLFFGNDMLAKFFIFVFLFVVIGKLFKLLTYILDKAFNLLRFVPFTKLINKFAGAIFGLLEGSLIVGLIVYFIVRFPFNEALLMKIESSEIARQLLKFAEILTPLIPEALTKMKVLINI